MRLEADDATPDWPALRAMRQRRAEFLTRIYEIDPLRCVRCGGEMRILSFILDADIFAAILRHLQREGPLHRHARAALADGNPGRRRSQGAPAPGPSGVQAPLRAVANPQHRPRTPCAGPTSTFAAELFSASPRCFSLSIRPDTSDRRDERSQTLGCGERELAGSDGVQEFVLESV